MLVRNTLETRILKDEVEGVVWIELKAENGEKMAIGVVYANPEGVRCQETEEQFEKVADDVLKWRSLGYKVLLMGDFNAHIGRGEEEVPNKNGRRLLNLAYAGNLVIGNELSVCKGRWTWECREKKSVIDYMLFQQEHRQEVVEMVVEDRGIIDTGSDHNVIWCIFKAGVPKEEKSEERLKWRVDGRRSWEEFQEAVEEEFEGWEDCVRDLENRVEGGELSERIWGEWKKRVPAAAESGIG